MANEYAVNKEDLELVANKLREKLGESRTIAFPHEFFLWIDEVFDSGFASGYDSGYNSRESGVVTQMVSGNLTEYENEEITSIRECAFSYCKQLTHISLPNVTAVPYNCFYYCSSLAEVNMPLVTTIGVQGFKGCEALEAIELPYLANVFESAFYSCQKLKRIDLGTSDKVRNQAFKLCSSLETVILRRETVVTLETTNAFQGTPIESGTGYVYVPDDLVNSYKKATNWVTYADRIKGLSELDQTLDEVEVKFRIYVQTGPESYEDYSGVVPYGTTWGEWCAAENIRQTEAGYPDGDYWRNDNGYVESSFGGYNVADSNGNKVLWDNPIESGTYGGAW